MEGHVRDFVDDLKTVVMMNYTACHATSLKEQHDVLLQQIKEQVSNPIKQEEMIRNLELAYMKVSDDLIGLEEESLMM